MGAALGCCGGPSTDYDSAFVKTARYHPILGRCDDVEKSLLRKLQRSLSTSWSARALVLEPLRSPQGASHTGSRYGLDEHYESESDTEPSGYDTSRKGDSNASATSGSRMLCDFYNLVLECDHSKFFVDASGRRVKGAYLNQIEILDDYFDTTRRTTVNARRRRRSSVDVSPYQPPTKHKHLSSHWSDRSSTMSLMSNETTQTLTSESDYWATFMETTDNVSMVGEYTNSLELTFPPRYPGPPMHTRQNSVDRRRSWVLQDIPLYGNNAGEVSMSPLLLFSPVNINKTDDKPRSRTSSRSGAASMRSGATSPRDKQHTFAMPNEGNRYNLWSSDSSLLQAKSSIAVDVPSVFSSAAVAERRRASLTMGSSGSATGAGHTGGRRVSIHTIAPVAAV